MWMMLQQQEPDDYVIATGETHSVRELVVKAYSCIGIKIVWDGQGVNEVGLNAANKDVLVRVDPIYFRPTEVDELLGDATKAKRVLGWEPITTFDALVEEMVAFDLQLAKTGDIFS
eukprot:TRINITY_DN1705_c0_g1_i2.p1 TRINITY_DN1705_c0_g1~~TRINITY_DN1705_c0_g1_i2.p1  ORF type:complete len:116 (-),score=28.39 TRINITY_DN1705_c0_g1_i2:173-520(-)